MALYQYDLYLVREPRGESLLSELADSGWVQPGDRSSGSVLSLGGAHAFAEQRELRTATGRVLEVLALLIENQDLHLITRDFDALVTWIQDVARASDLLIAFMPGGPDAAGTTPGAEEFVTALLEEGRVIAAHALMWFAVTVASGTLCAASGTPYRKIVASGLGCLFALVDVAADGSFEILEPGPDRSHLLAGWSAR
jgi:hypothetical protein